ncbi:MAG TPA: hypothetical protein VJH68_02560, partial [Candidatus Nanoarchaeia archaeon]|nr:hypothetical protein [Candidatus Nanoarchaeia archaeon]
SIVVAKGSSTYRTTQPVIQPVEEKCEDLEILQKRIKCRLEKSSSADIPEACLDLPIQGLCQDFYDRAGYCYDLSNDEKDSCFRAESGYRTNPHGQEKRLYINALLYELEEYVEDDFEQKGLTAEEAANFITDITNMKRALLSGKPLSEIKMLLSNYAARRGIKN